MMRPPVPARKQPASRAQRRVIAVITWQQVEEFAAKAGRSPSHVYRVITNERKSKRLAAAIEQHFGAPLEQLRLKRAA